jgi:hypothetical protein
LRDAGEVILSWRRAAVAGLVAVLAGAGLASCTSSGGAPQRTGPPTRGEVSSLLDRHAHAVLGHDRGAFLADVAGGRPAAAFRAGQAREFGNLTRLPLTAWSYRVVAVDNDKQARTAATKKYGAPAVIVQVTLRYALRGVDPAPTRHDLWWTFVRAGGKVQLAGDRDLEAAGGTSWQGPWDFGPLVAVTGAHSLVLGHPGDRAQLQVIADTVDAAVPDVTAVWGTDWTQDVAVLVPDTDAELKSAVGASSSITAEVAALAVSDGTDPVSGAVYGQRLIVEPASLTDLSAIGRRILYTHEITHIATAKATSDVEPHWLVEGFADYVANLHSGQSVATIATELRTDVRAGRVPATLPTAAQFETASTAAQAYEGSWLACRLIATRVGQDGLLRFYRLVGSTPGDGDQALAAALRSMLHETIAQFTSQWRTYLSAQLT